MSRRSADAESGLTPQMEAFCLALARTGNQSEAYREAYPKTKMNHNSLAVAASRLAASPKIQLRLSQLRSDAKDRAGITLAEHLKALGALRNLATKGRQYGAAVTAEVSRGKVSGLYDGVTDDDGPPPSRIIVEVVDGRKVP